MLAYSEWTESKAAWEAYHQSRPRGWKPSAGTSLPGGQAVPAYGFHSAAILHSPSQPAPTSARHQQCPKGWKTFKSTGVTCGPLDSTNPSVWLSSGFTSLCFFCTTNHPASLLSKCPGHRSGLFISTTVLTSLADISRCGPSSTR